MPAAGDRTPAAADLRREAAAPILTLAVRRKVYRPAGAELVEAVRDLALTVRAAETLCLIGPSGAGKTTTLRILLGLDRDFEGDLATRPDLRIGMVFQEPRLLPWRTVEENVRLSLPRSERGQPLDALFEELGLTAWRGRYPRALSLGMARRVALARALALAPGLLVLDEPFVSLDDAAAASLRAAVFGSAAARGAAVLMVTHNVPEALAVADRLLLLSGRPASLVAEVPIRTPKGERGRDWIEAMRRDLAARYPETVAEG
ncbi:NitT/TauT family transport system ATP-binding protein [Methylobacterium sp. 174MFSha1.1]|uniref:ATP-binding cassette domain-containing protein n=1 Tax=Methylobacterium sp. 174MFSha1.1 TaxID=1502749 RepID=UPI0008E13623|nr:ATP-binding cassette domain-containing protein [Methylobacterium sp. 174MFSha1.1]SFU40803.1 NitT/TauT family transport system ATP-binding protein [Methylobacterium sp. 174MFSha1.1]